MNTTHSPLLLKRPLREHPSLVSRLGLAGFGFGMLRIWQRRWSNRQALRHDFHGASPQWLARIERDIGLEPGTLKDEMQKPFWSE
ncbi:hypothetical protein [Marinobacter sp. V034]|uniref:hypothetical protein n=1 Tax=Marinobacter sp. V034 TaxID=3459610 RepID=UPI004043FDAE